MYKLNNKIWHVILSKSTINLGTPNYEPSFQRYKLIRKSYIFFTTHISVGESCVGKYIPPTNRIQPNAKTSRINGSQTQCRHYHFSLPGPNYWPSRRLFSLYPKVTIIYCMLLKILDPNSLQMDP